jgi:hypothetical protein
LAGQSSAGDVPPDLPAPSRVEGRQIVSFRLSHIAHDLALVLGDSLEPGGNPPVFRNPPAMDRNEQRSIYLSFNSDFEELLLEALREGDLGLRGRLAGWLPGAGIASRTLGQWVIALRVVSWVHGEMLWSRGRTPEDRQRLLRAVESAAETTANRFWMLGLPIQPPALMAAPLLLVWDPWIALVAVGIAALGVYLWWLYEARIVAYLGYRVYVAVVRSLEDMGAPARESISR